ncbi:MAG: TRAM domain-containing protein, partial [Opitutae bacterium]|nr:TRAM domain-containing protein [Opitutae bacterium]
KDIVLRKNQERVGKVEPVLVEGFDPENYLMTGRLTSQAPDIDGQVIIEKCETEPGEIVPVLINQAADYDLVGEPISETTSRES